MENEFRSSTSTTVIKSEYNPETKIWTVTYSLSIEAKEGEKEYKDEVSMKSEDTDMYKALTKAELSVRLYLEGKANSEQSVDEPKQIE